MMNIEQKYTDDEIKVYEQRILHRKRAAVRLARSKQRWEGSGFLFKTALFAGLAGAIFSCGVAPLIHFGVLATSAAWGVLGAYVAGATIEPLRVLLARHKVRQAEYDLEQFKSEPVPAIAAALRQEFGQADVSRIAAVLGHHVSALTRTVPVDSLEHLQTNLSRLSGQARTDFLAKAVKVIAPALADAEKAILFEAQAKLEDAQAIAEAARERLSRVEMQAATSLRYVETALLPAKDNAFSHMISKNQS